VGDLKEQIRAATVTAMKAGEKDTVGALRMLSAAITNREKDARRDLTDDEIREVAAKEVKKRNESIEAFSAAGREELVAKERAELAVLAAYAPEQLSDAELDAIIDEAIAASGATSAKEMGKVMGAVMAKAKGRVDGGVVQEKVRARLG
jgi:uncharacterized protein YqeY